MNRCPCLSAARHEAIFTRERLKPLSNFRYFNDFMCAVIIYVVPHSKFNKIKSSC